jgi:hypothetical protein
MPTESTETASSPDQFEALDPTAVIETRLALHQLATHVLGRRRHAFTGRFGLRAAPGGMATPAFGDDVEVVRTSGRHVVVERGGAVLASPVTTLAAAAQLAGVDLTLDFAVGDDTPAMVEPDAPLAVDDAAARALAGWWAFGTTVLDEVVASGPGVTAPTSAQLWPEHLDVGCTVTVTGGERVNLGVSPGDGYEPLPYLYVGPWSDARPGDPSFWNAPFGAVLRHADLALLPPPDRRPHALTFAHHALTLLAT